MTTTARSRIWVVFLSLLLFSTVAIAQTGRSTVKGTVKDPQGNVVAGATVTLANPERSFTRTQTTADNGTYTFASVPPGTYKLDVEATGFKKVAIAEVMAPVDSTAEVDVALEVGSVTEVVNVMSGAEAPLNTSDATVAIAIGREPFST